jgi:hypothetical protein
MKTSKRRKAKGSFRSPSAVKREIQALRDWAMRNVEVEFIIPLAGGSITHLGRIIETSSDGGIADFHFASRSGMRAMLVPQLFPKSQVDNVGGLQNGLYVEGKRNGEHGFTVREYLFERKPNPNLESVLEKLRTWARLQLDLHVFLSEGAHAISFLGQARELSSGMFSFARPSAAAQLIIRVEEYKYMKLKSEDDKSHITLIDPRTEELCVVSDTATQPEALFRRFAEVSSTIH